MQTNQNYYISDSSSIEIYSR